MGVLNITPDSFSDGGTLYDGETVRLDTVRDQALAMVRAGAAILDIGGESSRPGALTREQPKKNKDAFCRFSKPYPIWMSCSLWIRITQKQFALPFDMAWA